MFWTRNIQKHICSVHKNQYSWKTVCLDIKALLQKTLNCRNCKTVTWNNWCIYNPFRSHLNLFSTTISKLSLFHFLFVYHTFQCSFNNPGGQLILHRCSTSRKLSLKLIIWNAAFYCELHKFKLFLISLNTRARRSFENMVICGTVIKRHYFNPINAFLVTTTVLSFVSA